MMPSKPTHNKSPWNSLEIAKLSISAIAPFILAFFGYLIWGAQRAIVEQREIVLKEEQKAADVRARLTRICDSCGSRCSTMPLLSFEKSLRITFM